MIRIRHSPDAEQNDRIRDSPPERGETNAQWLGRHGPASGLLMIGGASVADFRIRVAQSHLRSDLLPSFWSLVGILVSETEFVSVPLELQGPAADIPARNGVQQCRVADYDDPERYPNVALFRFAENAEAVHAQVTRVRQQRAVIDLPSLMLPWLAFIWGAGQSTNPLLNGHGLPSAVFVEAVYNLSNIELTPGLSSASTCPEAIWQAAKWWRTYYDRVATQAESAAARPVVPSGFYAIRQREASARQF